MVHLSLTGHRPKELFGYDLSEPEYTSIRKRLAKLINYFVEKDGEVVGHTGMALGADTLYALVLLDAKKHFPGKVKLHAEIPHPTQSAKWPREEDRLRYNYIMNNADDSTLYSDEYTPWCLQKRNEGMLDHGDHLIAIWDGTIKPKSGTSNAIKYSIRRGSGYYVLRPSDNLVRYDLPNASLLKKTGHAPFTRESIEEVIAARVETERARGSEVKVNGNSYLFRAADGRLSLLELKKEVISPSFEIWTIKDYAERGGVFINTENSTFIKKLK